MGLFQAGTPGKRKGWQASSLFPSLVLVLPSPAWDLRLLIPPEMGGESCEVSGREGLHDWCPGMCCQNSSGSSSTRWFCGFFGDSSPITGDPLPILSCWSQSFTLQPEGMCWLMSVSVWYPHIFYLHRSFHIPWSVWDLLKSSFGDLTSRLIKTFQHFYVEELG